MTFIRPVATPDFEAWLPLWRGYQDFYRTEILDEVTRVTWARFLDPDEPMWAALAKREGRAVGMVHWIFHRSTLLPFSDFQGCRHRSLLRRSVGEVASVRTSLRL